MLLLSEKDLEGEKHGTRGDSWQLHGGPDGLILELKFLYSGSCRYQFGCR